MNILLVDDDASLVEVMARLIRMLGHTVDTALSGEEAAAMLSVDMRQFDLLITDQQMERVSGIELIALARKHSPETACVLMSGHVDAVDGRSLANDSNARYIEKPFTLDTIQALLEDVKAAA